MYRVDIVRFRVDVGIDPYIETGGAPHSTGRVDNPIQGGTMWASSPTFTLNCVPFNGER